MNDPPRPEDPIAAFRGSLAEQGPSTDAARRLSRDEELRREEELVERRRRPQG